MRMDTISTFEEGKLMDDGELPFNEKLASEFLVFDIIRLTRKFLCLSVNHR